MTELDLINIAIRDYKKCGGKCRPRLKLLLKAKQILENERNS